MTELPQPDDKRGAIHIRATFFRVLSGIAGSIVALLGIVLPVFFIASADYAWELIPALGFITLCGFVAYRLFRFSTKGLN